MSISSHRHVGENCCCGGGDFVGLGAAVSRILLLSADTGFIKATTSLGSPRSCGDRLSFVTTLGVACGSNTGATVTGGAGVVVISTLDTRLSITSFLGILFLVAENWAATWFCGGTLIGVGMGSLIPCFTLANVSCIAGMSIGPGLFFSLQQNCPTLHVNPTYLASGTGTSQC